MDWDKKAKLYLKESEKFRKEEGKEERTLLLLSVLRLVLFMGGLALTVYGFTRDNTFGILSLVIFTVLFMVVLKLFSQNQKITFQILPL